MLGWPANFFHGIANGIKFRRVELKDPLRISAQHLLNACALTLESLTTVCECYFHDIAAEVVRLCSWLCRRLVLK